MQNFKTRNELIFKKLYGEHSSLNLKTWVSEGITPKKLLYKYNENDTFNDGESVSLLQVATVEIYNL